jgi:phosphoribosyl 1,2-cyclic phosphodiesterase
LITHEHGDHIQGAKALSKDGGIPLWLNEGTRRTCRSFDSLLGIKEFQTGERFEVGGLLVEPIPLSHDAVDPVCFAVMTERHKIGVVTDLGTVDDPVVEGLQHSDLLLLEFNHDLNMIQNGPYHPHLKARVLSERGHLSNEESALFLAHLLHPNLKTVILGHLSQVNNHPDLAYLAARRAVTRRPPYEDLAIYVAHQEFQGPLIPL